MFNLFSSQFSDNNNKSNKKESISFKATDNITTFLDSLTYWQTINLYIMLDQMKHDSSFEEAKGEAIANYSYPDKLHYLLEEAINSPYPKKKKRESNFQSLMPDLSKL